MSIVTSTSVGQWSTVTTSPAITTATFLRRDRSKWKTCGYIDGDPESPLTLKDADLCQATAGAMVYCYTDGENPCDSKRDRCYAATETPDWACTDDTAPCPPAPVNEIWCDVDYPECARLTWTDIDVYRSFCETKRTVLFLSFSHPETTDETISASKTTTFDTSASRTATAAAATTSSSKRKRFTEGQIAGMTISFIFVIVVITVALFQFYRKRRDAAAANKRHTGIVIMKSAKTQADAANAAAMRQRRDELGLPTEQKPPLQEDRQATHTPEMAGAAAPLRNAQTPGTVSPVLQLLPSSTGTSAMASPTISPMPSPAVSPAPYAPNLSSQPSTSQFSTISSQPTPDANRGNFVTMPPFSPTPPPDQRPSPGPENNIRNLPANPSQLSIPLTGTGNPLVDDPPYTSLYNSYQQQLPRFSDPPFTRFSQGRTSMYIGEHRPPTMAASWFEDRGSVISEMDAGPRTAAISASDGASGGGAAGAAGGAGLGDRSKKNRQTGMSELMGSVPGQAR